MPIVLYKLDGSPPSRAVNMVVHILGLQVQAKQINTIAGEQMNPEFVAKNPVHKIPVIEDGDFVLSDSHAIITYLVSKYGADKRAQLYPSDLRVRATVDQRLFFEDSMLFPRFGRVAVSLIREKATEVSAENIASVEEAYGFLEKYLEVTLFLAADHVTLADISCVSTVSTLDVLVPIDEKFPKLRDWLNRLKEYDWYQAGNAPGLAQMSTLLKISK